MMEWLRHGAGILAAALGAHALAFVLTAVLPDAAIIALGFEGANRDVLAAFNAAHQARPYDQVVADLLRLDFGRTLDGVAVGPELIRSVIASTPRLLSALLLIAVAMVLAALLPPHRGSWTESAARFVAFLPPYVLPFLGLVGLLSLTFSAGVSVGDVGSGTVAVVTLALAPAALVFAQVRAIVRRNLSTEFARMLLAIGASRFEQSARLLHNVLAELSPSLEKVATSLIAVLVFLEPVFGVDGFGTTAVRAIRRSDIDLILGVTLVMAIGVGVFKVLSIWVRRQYGLMA